MPRSLIVRVLGLEGNDPLEGAHVAAGPAEEDGLAPAPDLPEGERFDVPDDGQMVARITRDDAPGMVFQVALDLADNEHPGFKHARPRCMELSATRAGDAVTFLLTARLGEPQEVVLASGTSPAEQFAYLARGRFTRLVHSGEVEPSCLLTLFRCDREGGYTLAVETYLVDRSNLGRLTKARLREGQGTAILTRQTFDSRDSRTSILTLYRYLAQIGAARRANEELVARVREVGFISHAYWIGPVLFNSGRRKPRCNEPIPRPGQRPRLIDQHDYCSTFDCHEHCPTHGAHRNLSHMRIPILRHWSPPYRYFERYNAEMRAYLHVVLSQRDGESDVGYSRVHTRNPADRDPRNTDFAHPRQMDVSVPDMQRALHADCILRVWGCNNGALGPLFRIWRHSRNADEVNQRLEIPATWDRHGDRRTLAWKVREGDVRLLFLSRLRRCYAQAVAEALQRPCYGAVPGSFGEYRLQKLGCMEARASGLVSPVAFDDLYPEGVPDGELTERDRRELRLRSDSARANQMKDRGGYVRFSPNPAKVPVTINVLVTGFTPFRAGRDAHFVAFNTAQETVRELANVDVAALVNAPDWIEPTVNVHTDPEVDVVWTCPAPRAEDESVPERSSPAPAGDGGAKRILAKAAEVDASIVIIVGESQRLRIRGKELRLERFASNLGSSGMPDNDGQRLERDADGWHDREDHDGRPLRAGPIFPARPVNEKLESTVPLRSWLQVMARLRRDPGRFLVDNGSGTNIETSTGQFVCNETFYQALIESREGTRPLGRGFPRRRATGRWVEMVHVASKLPKREGRRWVERQELDADARSGHERLAQGLAVVVASLVEEQMWATDVWDMEISHGEETVPAWPAPPPDDYFEAEILGSDGRPRAGLDITLRDSAGGEHVATTDDRGVVRFEGLPPGEVEFDLPEDAVAVGAGDGDSAPA